MKRLFLLSVVCLLWAPMAEARKPAPPASQLPPAKLSLWLDGLHFKDGNLNEQSDVHHFCAAPEKGPIQCTLWDGHGAEARLIGVEYIIDESAFRALPEKERALWHQHRYEVMSGALVAPGMSEKQELEFLRKAISTYGKTWHTWNSAMDADLPIGRPELMMGFTRDGQMKAELLSARDQSLAVNTQELRSRREAAITQLPQLVPGADKGEGGKSCRDNRELRAARRAPPGR